MNRLTRTAAAFAAGIAAALAGCSRDNDKPAPAEHVEPPSAPTNRVSLPPAVRANLGVTFAKVERRAVARTIRTPGRFEFVPHARREYRTMLAGQVEPAVQQFARVETGQVVFRLRSPRWNELQQQLADADAAIRAANAGAEMIGPLREAHRVHETALEETVALWTERVKQLRDVREAGGGKADELAAALATLAAARAELAETLEKDAELGAREHEIASQLDSARTRRELILASAAMVTGIDVDQLSAQPPDQPPAWRAIDLVEVRAAAPGIVESINLTAGAWADESTLVLSTVQPDLLRFHAQGLQSDLPRFQDGLTATVAPSAGAPIAASERMTGPLSIGLQADPESRTVELYMTPASLAPWAKAGVAAYLEVTLDNAAADLAIPRAAVVADGLVPHFFRRDPNDPDTVIRTEADIGLDDGRWVVIKSGVREGDEIVLDGVYQLMLATSGTAAKGGHFHSDGTFHEGEHK